MTDINEEEELLIIISAEFGHSDKRSQEHFFGIKRNEEAFQTFAKQT